MSKWLAKEFSTEPGLEGVVTEWLNRLEGQYEVRQVVSVPMPYGRFVPKGWGYVMLLAQVDEKWDFCTKLKEAAEAVENRASSQGQQVQLARKFDAQKLAEYEAEIRERVEAGSQ